MKKIIFAIATLFATLALTGCSAQWGVIYSVKAKGDADGKVAITFPNGAFDTDGKATLNFVFSNDTTKALRVSKAIPLETALKANDKDVIKAAQSVDNWVVDSFRATAASGTYYVYFAGYVKETLTGLTFSIDREFTNR